MHALDITERWKRYLSPWLTVAGKRVNPDAPSGGGGPGRFRQPGTLFADYDMFPPIAHPLSPSADYLAQNVPATPPTSATDAGGAAPPPPPQTDINKTILKAAQPLVSQPRLVLPERTYTTKSGKMLRISKGDGFCAELPEKLLTDAGAYNEWDFTPLTGSGELGTKKYIWGTKVEVADAKAGDIVQFNNYEYTSTRTITVTKKDSTGKALSPPVVTTETRNQKKIEMHTAVLESNDGGRITVIDQHVHGGTDAFKNVNRDVFEAKSVTNRTTVTTSPPEWEPSPIPDQPSIKVSRETSVSDTVVVKGDVVIYRPQKK